MSRLEKIIYLTKSQYNTLNTGGTTTVGGTTLNGINDDYIYITSDPFSVNDLDGVLPINRGGTGLISIANNSMLIGNSDGEFTTINKTTSITSNSTDSEIPTAKAAYTYIYNNVLYKSGGTMTGKLTLLANQYDDSITSSTSYALNMNNSNIIELNGIYTADTSEGGAEGINFYRDATHFDSLWMASGNIYFSPNRALGTNTNAANSEKVVRMPASITEGTALIASGTNGFTSLRGIRDNTSAGALGWTSSSTDITLVTTNTIAYWDGRYQPANNASNLEYCKKGKFGNLAIKDSLSYSDVSAAPAAGSTSITTLGTITTGTWHGTAIEASYISGTISTNQLPNPIPTSKLNILTDNEVINLLQSVSSGGTVESPGTLDVFDETKDGLVPTPGSATNKILKSDGTWVLPNITIEQLVDGDNIYQQINTYLDNTLVKVSGSEKIITIWKNTGAANQTFAAQTLSFASGLQPNKFNFIIIEYTIYTGDARGKEYDHMKTEIISVNSPYKYRLLTGRLSSNATTGARLVTLTNNDTEIAFEQAYWGTSANNRYIVPYTIYGIKL